MERFEYQILTGRDQLGASSGVVWYSVNNLDQALGSELSEILNRLGSEGWEISGIGDIGYNKRSEIVLKRRAAN